MLPVEFPPFGKPREGYLSNICRWQFLILIPKSIHGFMEQFIKNIRKKYIYEKPKLNMLCNSNIRK